MIDLERDLITKMLISDFQIAESMLRIGNLERARDAIKSALDKIDQLESLKKVGLGVPAGPTTIDV